MAKQNQGILLTEMVFREITLSEMTASINSYFLWLSCRPRVPASMNELETM